LYPPLCLGLPTSNDSFVVTAAGSVESIELAKDVSLSIVVCGNPWGVFLAGGDVLLGFVLAGGVLSSVVESADWVVNPSLMLLTWANKFTKIRGFLL
jgi:hypothetical protein